MDATWGVKPEGMPPAEDAVLRLAETRLRESCAYIMSARPMPPAVVMDFASS